MAKIFLVNSRTFLLYIIYVVLDSPRFSMTAISYTLWAYGKEGDRGKGAREEDGGRKREGGKKDSQTERQTETCTDLFYSTFFKSLLFL